MRRFEPIFTTKRDGVGRKDRNLPYTHEVDALLRKELEPSSSAPGKVLSYQLIQMAKPHFLLALSVLFFNEFSKTSDLVGMVLENMPNRNQQLIT